MRDKKTQLIKVERVDDIPVLLHHMSTMQIAALLDQYFLTHGNWTGETTLGEVAVGWLSFIVSAGDHCLSHVESWAEEHQATLSAGLGKAIRPLDFHDDRLADILSALAQTEPWNDFETTRTGQLLRVYGLEGDRVRIDSPTGKTYAGVRPDGLFQFGHSKDHRPDLPQVKINRSALDPLGLPLTTTIVDGQSADDPLYVPEIQRVQRILGAGGKTYIGDGKMGALATRAYVAHRRDYYLCPLAGTQMPAAELEALLAPVLSGEPPLEPIYHPDTVRRKKPVLLAEGYPTSVTQTAEVDGETVTWTERRLVVRSVAYAAAQAQALDKRLAQACAEIEQLNVRKQGKARVAEEELPTAAPAILEPRGVQDLVFFFKAAATTEKKKRKYGPRPARVVSQRHGTIHAHIDPAAVD